MDKRAAQQASADAMQQQPLVRVDDWNREGKQAQPAKKPSTVLNPWPADTEVRGVLTLRLCPDQTDGLVALCSVKHDVFTIRVESRHGSGLGPDHCQGLESAKIEIALECM